MGKLDGKVAIVTGSGQGLGKAYAKAIANAGAAVTIVDLNEEAAKTTTEEINANGGRAIYCKCDVSDDEQVGMVVTKTVEAFGTINVLINNAQGLVPPAPLETYTARDFEFSWKTGALGSFLFMKAVFPFLKENKGSIINVCSSTGIKGMLEMSAYGSNKEAIRGLTRHAAHEWGKYGINVNVIGPSAMTPSAKAWSENEPAAYQAQLNNIPMRRLGDPDTDLASAIVFLASDDAKFITGQTIMIDGGETFIV